MPPVHRRLGAATLLALVIGVGLLSRLRPIGWSLFDKSLGDVLYAVAAYLALVGLWPRGPIVTVAAVATGACFAVEFLQLTDLNATLLTVPVLRAFLGRGFQVHDLVCYVVGVAIAAGVDRAIASGNGVER